MEKAKVYFDDFRAPVGTSVLKKLDRLIRKAGMEEMDFQPNALGRAFYLSRR